MAPKGDEWTIKKLLEWTATYFTSHDIDSPRAAAEILLAHALNLQRVDLYLRYDQPLVRDELRDFKELLRRRILKEPVAYILGRREFWSMDLSVSRDVLIPRPETECLVEQALAVLNATDTTTCRRILELGTGSGAIVLALLSRMRSCAGIASDISYRALQVARNNARVHGLDDRVHFLCADWTQPFKTHCGCLDLIISNPPYIQTRQIKNLQPEIHRYEPFLALDGGEDGLRCLREIILEAHQFLQPGGTLLLETGHDQRQAVQQIVMACGHYEPPVFYKDYGGYDRVVSAKKKSKGAS
jgi:release factor glutamine methyltransferase